MRDSDLVYSRICRVLKKATLSCEMNQFSYRRMNRIFSIWHVRHRFQSAKKRGDLRYLAVRGYGLGVPLPEHLRELELSILTCTNYRLIRGTSDVIRSSGQAAFQNAARRYARRYNLLVYESIGVAKPEGFIAKRRWF